MACSKAASPPPIVAQVSGTLTIDGLSSSVRVIRDRWGIPHVYAQSRDDLFFAQGFVQAQDRLFQMDLWRRSVQGRLSQVLGANFIERDAMTRRVQYRGDLDAEWASYGPDAKAIATAFVRGVNAWVALAHERPPEEFALAGWTPEFWMPADLLNRTDLFVASRGTIDARQWASAGPQAAEVIADALRRVGSPPFFVGLAADVKTVRLKPDTTDPAHDPVHNSGRDRARDPGSVGLQTDQPLRLDHPSQHYLVHLHAAGWNAIGATAPWMPGVSTGHDERAAWDATATAIAAPIVDTIRVNPDNPHQIDDDGKWVDAEIVTDFIVVKGRKPFSYESAYTRRGVIVATDRDRHLAFTMRWQGVEAGTIPALHALAMDRTSLPPLRGAPSGSAASGPSARLGSGVSRTERSSTVVFAHPLGISVEGRVRFNIGPLALPASLAPAFRVGAGSTEWDHWTAMNAPGQSESPDSAHFTDLAAEWAAGRSIPLPFSDRTVESAAETTLLLTSRRPQP